MVCGLYEAVGKKTGASARRGKCYRPLYLEEVQLGGIGLSKDIEGAVVFIASEDANYITAQTLIVDDGNWKM